MALNKRARKPKTETPEFDDFVNQGGTVAEAAPTPGKTKAERGKSTDSAVPAWRRRAATAKKTESQPFRYNEDQHRLLQYAKQVDGRDYSKILAEIVWPALEKKYGSEVPFD